MIFGIDNQLCRPPQTKAGERRSAPILQFNKVIANGRLQKWPPFAKGSLSGSRTGFAALLAYGGYYRALA
jgi:hypothetical protein